MRGYYALRRAGARPPVIHPDVLSVFLRAAGTLALALAAALLCVWLRTPLP